MYFQPLNSTDKAFMLLLLPPKKAIICSVFTFVSLSVCLFISEQDCSKSYVLIFTKLAG